MSFLPVGSLALLSGAGLFLCLPAPKSLSLPSAAQRETTVTILIKGAPNGRLLPGALLTDLDTGAFVIADAKGQATLPPRVYGGHARLEIDAPNYLSRVIEILLPDIACTNCEPTEWTQIAELDPVDWFISPVIDSTGFSHDYFVPTGIHPHGSMLAYQQEFHIDVPTGAWVHPYRLGFTPMRNDTFDRGLIGPLPPDRFPVAGFSFRFLDPDTKAPVHGENLQEPITVTMGPAFLQEGLDLPRSVLALRADFATGSWTNDGVASTSLQNGKIVVEVDQAGVYQVFLGDVQPPQDPRQAPVAWQLVSEQWLPCDKDEGLIPGFANAIFACTTYTDGQAERYTFQQEETKTVTRSVDVQMTADTQAEIPLLGGIDIEISGQGGSEWKSQSTVKSGFELGDRVYSDPRKCGEVCVVPKILEVVLEKVIGSRAEDGSIQWTPADPPETRSYRFYGPPCVDDSELVDCP